MRLRLHQKSLVGLLGLILAASFALDGRAVLFCHSMQRVMARCCCTSSTDSAPANGTLRRAACCETTVVASGAVATGEPSRSQVSRPMAAPLALLATVGEAVEPTGAIQRIASAGGATRAGPRAPTYALLCSYLI